MIGVVDTGVANLGSISNMLRRIGAEPVVSSNPEELRKASKLILPGVGAFDRGMRALHELNLTAVLQEQVVERGVPVLGICLGMQLLTRGSEEGTMDGLGWIDARAVRLDSSVTTDCQPLRVPHMGWNTVRVCQHRLFSKLDAEPRFYFVHSYYVDCARREDILATAHYGRDFPAAIGRENIWGVQFHPEKSHRFGMQLLTNFVGQA